MTRHEQKARLAGFGRGVGIFRATGGRDVAVTLEHGRLLCATGLKGSTRYESSMDVAGFDEDLVKEMLAA